MKITDLLNEDWENDTHPGMDAQREFDKQKAAKAKAKALRAKSKANFKGYGLTPDQVKADDDGNVNVDVRQQNTIRTSSQGTGKDSKFYRKATSTSDQTATDPTTGKKSYSSSIDSTSTADQDRNTVWHRTSTQKNHLTGKGKAVVDGDKDTQKNMYGGDHDAIDMIRKQEKDIADLRTMDIDDKMDAADAKIAKAKKLDRMKKLAGLKR